ncbi:hypothetical protein DV738_g3863, partial [Chaetothyriales sp. CBS 135597]
MAATWASLTSPINLLLAWSLLLLLGLASAADPPSASWVRGGGANNVSLAVNVPDNSTDALFFHFNAPASISSWAAFGFGDQMNDALMFVVYASADGQSVTVSPRLGNSHNQPQYTDNVTVTLFGGSGITNGVFNVNAMCTGCRSWSGGSLDVTSTSADMIWALGPARILASSDVDANIVQHQVYGNIQMNLVEATGLGGVPIVGTGTNGSSSNSGSVGWSVTPGTAAHAGLMILAFLVAFPGGFLFLRLFNRVWLHLGIQSAGVVMVILGTAAGIVVSKKDQIHPKIDSGHQILGIVILVLILAAWTLGFVSHLIFRRTGQPAKLMIGHRVVAPLAITLGLVNVCIGFNFAGNNKPIIGFIVLIIIMVIIVSSSILIKRRRAVRKAALNTPAAMNFREGQEAGRTQGAAPPSYSTPAVPLESFQPPGREFRR